MAEMIRIHLHCDNLYDNIPDSERFVPYEEGIHPLRGEPFGRDVAGGDNIKDITVEGSEVIFNGQRLCLEQGEATVKAKFMYYKGIVPNPLYYTITLSKIEDLEAIKMEEKKQVYITLTDYYRTFDGGDNTTYRFPIRVGVFSYDEDMTWIKGDYPRYKKLEIVEITDETVSFVVDKDFLDGKESAIHTLKLSGEEKVFERITQEYAKIYDEHYDYEQIHRLTIRTEN